MIALFSIQLLFNLSKASEIDQVINGNKFLLYNTKEGKKLVKSIEEFKFSIEKEKFEFSLAVDKSKFPIKMEEFKLSTEMKNSFFNLAIEPKTERRKLIDEINRMIELRMKLNLEVDKLVLEHSDNFRENTRKVKECQKKISEIDQEVKELNIAIASNSLKNSKIMELLEKINILEKLRVCATSILNQSQNKIDNPSAEGHLFEILAKTKEFKTQELAIAAKICELLGTVCPKDAEHLSLLAKNFMLADKMSKIFKELSIFLTILNRTEQFLIE
jgi:hypothetical protein